MSRAAAIALANPTLIEEQQADPRFGHVTPLGTLVVTVRKGWG